MKKIIAYVCGSHFLNHMFVLTLPPLFPILLKEFSLSYTKLGLLATTSSLAMIILQIPSGFLSDRIGRKPILAFGLFLSSLGVFVSGIAKTYDVLLLSQLILGVGGSCYHPAGLSIISERIPYSVRGRVLGFHGFSGILGSALTPLSVSIIAVFFNWRIALISISALGFIYTILFTIFFERKKPKIIKKKVTSSPFVLAFPILVAALIFIFRGMAFKGILSFTPQYLFDVYRVELSEANTLFTLMLVTGGISQIFGGYLGDRFNKVKVIFIFYSLATIFILAISAGIFKGMIFEATLILLGILYFLPAPVMQSIISEVSGERKGSAFGIVFTSASFGGALAPAILGFAADIYGMIHTYTIIGIFMGVASFFSLTFFSKRMYKT